MPMSVQRTERRTTLRTSAGGADEAVDGVWFIEGDGVPFFGGEAAADFEGCGEEEAFDFADGALVGEVLP